MNRTVVLFCLLAGLYGCGGGDAGQKEMQEFEGVVTYRITYKNRDFTPTFGDSMRVYYSKGRMARLYNGKGANALVKEVILMRSHGYYAQKKKSDTVETYDISKDGNYDLVNTKRSVDDTRILGHTCQGVELDLVHKGSIKYYFFDKFLYSSDVLKVDKQYFKDWNLLHVNRFIDAAGSLYLKYELKIADDSNVEPWSITFTAVDIHEQKIDPGMFYIDTTIVRTMAF